MKVRDIMKRDPLTLREDDALALAQGILAWAGVRHVLVVRDGRLTGILSDRDLLSFRAVCGAEINWKTAPVRAAMHGSPQTAHPDDSLTEVAARMAQAKIGALPVVDEGRLVGIITTIDVLAGEVRQAMAPGAPSAPTASSPTAAEAMTCHPVTVRPFARLLDAAALMAEHRVSHLPVVDERGCLVGMLSERDVRAAVGDPLQVTMARESRVGPARLSVSDAMSRPAVTADQDVPIAQLAYLFADRALGALPVVDRQDKLIGILSYVDVLRSLARAASM